MKIDLTFKAILYGIFCLPGYPSDLAIIDVMFFPYWAAIDKICISHQFSNSLHSNVDHLVYFTIPKMEFST